MDWQVQIFMKVLIKLVGIHIYFHAPVQLNVLVLVILGQTDIISRNSIQEIYNSQSNTWGSHWYNVGADDAHTVPHCDCYSYCSCHMECTCNECSCYNMCCVGDCCVGEVDDRPTN